MTRCTNHCGACHRHFHSLKAFDAHRAGKYATGRYCLSPVEVFYAHGEPRLVALTDTGECRMYAEVEKGVTVWTLAQGLTDAEMAFSASGDALEGDEIEIAA